METKPPVPETPALPTYGISRRAFSSIRMSSWDSDQPLKAQEPIPKIIEQIAAEAWEEQMRDG